MTTITVDAAAGVMCSDSHWTDGREKGPMRKVWRVNGALVGFAGNLDSIAATKAYIQAGCHGKPPAAADAVALVLDGGKVRVWTRADGFTPVPGRYAIGSGGAAARAALVAGASASQALAIARNIDATTSGRTRVYKLKAS
jgi:UDP-N-acetylmuramyl tripeptide synthase